MFDETVKGAHVLALADARASQHLRQEGDPQDRRHQGPEGARPGDADRGHDVPGLWRADRPHAVRQRLHLAADRRGRRRRERRQRLPGEQALRGGAGAVDDRARGQQQPDLDQRQAVVEPDAPSRRAGCRRRPTRSRKDAAGARRSSSSTSRRPSSRSMGVKIVTDVDKSGFIKVAEPFATRSPRSSARTPTKIRQLIRAVK